MVASLLTDEPLTLVNVPHLTDISQLAEILAGLGVEMTMSGNGHAEAELGRARTLQIQGVERLKGASYTVLPDRIETGTYVMAVAATGGEVELIGARADLIASVIPMLNAAGVHVAPTNRGLKVARNGAHYTGVD